MTDANIQEYSNTLRSLYRGYIFCKINGTNFEESTLVSDPEHIDTQFFILKILLTEAPSEKQIYPLRQELDTLFTKDLGIETVISQNDYFSFFFFPEEKETIAFFSKRHLEKVAACAQQMHAALSTPCPERRPLPSGDHPAKKTHG